MGIRQAFGRKRDAERAEPGSFAAPADTHARRHQADPATGELMAVPAPRPPATAQVTPAPSAPAPSAPPATALVTPAPSAPAPAAPAPSAPHPAAPAPIAPAVAHRPARVGGLVVGGTARRQTDQPLPLTYSRSPKPYDRTVVRHAWDLVADRSDELVRAFYAELFVRLGAAGIDAFAMFPASMVNQREDFGRALVQWVVTDDPDAMSTHLAQLGADHRKFDVEPRHYDIAAQALVSAWKRLIGSRWTQAHEDAIVASYTRLASTMIDGALAHQDEPTAWGATVVEHERVLRDFAVLRLQPDQPYPFQAGQYLTVELAQRTREWRQMSVASAPRGDNTLDLQVRSINATGVSASLVMHTGVGDRLRLGPPRGHGLVVAPGSIGAGGLLCVCAGTGAAPVTAVVESLLARPERTLVHVYVGARTAADLWPADHLARTVERAGHSDHVRVHGIVSQDPSWTGTRGRVEDVVPTVQPWAQLGVRVLVAGPDPMISATVSGLVAAGVPAAHVRYDQFDVS